MMPLEITQVNRALTIRNCLGQLAPFEEDFVLQGNYNLRDVIEHIAEKEDRIFNREIPIAATTGALGLPGLAAMAPTFKAVIAEACAKDGLLGLLEVSLIPAMLGGTLVSFPYFLVRVLLLLTEERHLTKVAWQRHRENNPHIYGPRKPRTIDKPPPKNALTNG